MNLVELRREARAYNSRLKEFRERKKLPITWFDAGIDHFAIKAYNPDDYDKLVKNYQPLSSEVAESVLDDRRIATARLLGNYGINIYDVFSDGPVRLLEIMEARPDDTSEESVRFDHQEIYVPRGILPIKTVLRRKQIDFFEQENDAHSWVSVDFNMGMDEVKFTDKRLDKIVGDAVKNGRARLL